MSFVTPEFVLLFLLTVPLYFLLPHRPATWVLLIASYVFYMYWNAWFVLILVGTTVCDFHLAKAIARARRPGIRKACLALSVGLNIGILVFFKYAAFFSESLRPALGGLGVTYGSYFADIVLPIGISFYTFQELAYTIDVYRRVIEPEERFEVFSLFILFFPHLIAGPIVRAPAMLPQFRVKQPLVEAHVVEGLQLMLWGAFKKVVIADRLALYVNEVYGRPAEHSGPTLIVATVFFAFQIYCDFSGYSDLAIGTAKVMGFRLMTNFRQPYLATSITDFWRRWHISLSTWFKDYVYYPLGGNRVGPRRWAANVMVVFLLSGLWHGADWKFVVWGALHGGALLAERAATRLGLGRLASALGPVGDAARMALTFAFVCVAWIFFRASSLADAWHILTHLFHVPSRHLGLLRPLEEPSDFFWSLALIALLMAVDAADARWGIGRLLAARPRAVRWAVYYGATATILLFGVWGKKEFIYFQF